MAVRSTIARAAVTKRPLPQLQSDISLGARALDDVVTELADAGRLQDLASLLAARLAIAGECVLQILDDCAETPIALLCRSAGFSLNGYSAVLRLRRRRQRSSAEAPAVLLSAYRNLPRLSPEELAARMAMPTVGSAQRC